jgi:hypothetical protein
MSTTVPAGGGSGETAPASESGAPAGGGTAPAAAAPSKDLGSALDDAFAAATEADGKKGDGAAKPAAEAKPKTDPPTEGADDGEDDGDVLSVPAEDLAAIKANPALAKLYKGMAKAYTQKTQALGDERRLIEMYKADPKGTLRLLAQQAGMTIPDDPPPTPAEKATDAVFEELAAVIGPEPAKLLKPVFEKLAREVVKAEVGPTQQATTTLVQQALATQVDSDVARFKAAHGDAITPDVEKAMVEVSKKLPPAEGVDRVEYMEMLFKIVAPAKKEESAAAAVVERMKAAADKAEPTSRIQPGRVSDKNATKGLSLDAALEAAWDIARSEIGAQ